MALGASELRYRLGDALERQRVVGHIGEIVEQAVLVEDAYVVAVPGVELRQHLLQLDALLIGGLFIVAQYTHHHHVIGRGGHVNALLGVAVHLYLLHGCPLQHVGEGQGRVVLGKERVAEGLVDTLQARKQGAEAGLGAVAGVLLVAGGGLRHVVGGGQQVAAAVVLLLGQLVGALVGAVAHQAVEACPDVLCGGRINN